VLRDNSQREHSPHALAIAGRSPQDRVRLPFGELPLCTDSMPNLRQLEDDQPAECQRARHEGVSGELTDPVHHRAHDIEPMSVQL
jgi:hypothetical protein